MEFQRRRFKRFRRYLRTQRAHKKAAAPKVENFQHELVSDPEDETPIHGKHEPPIQRGQTEQANLPEECMEEQENKILILSTRRNMTPLQLAIKY